ncbi:dihydrolipoyl dehydrogenase family protein [Serinicoccus sediminis]|uniref:dihydrolipoyl dehydrogenase family protein n=1 Tax=Serinicoccus sediminis TaxID=2306021 RepID=UPI0010218DBA|nr:NAD(P)/FAD-dependent oxidoreductase [Serinicoccus sediminis]
MSRQDTTDHDVVVIGGGPAGENAADYAARGGLDVVVVEAELLGGECSYWACMPSKALLTPLDVAAQADHLGGLEAPALDRDALLDRRDSFTSDWDDEGQVDWARSAGLSIVRGRGRLTGEREVTVGDRVLRARRAVVVATGSEAVVPEVYAEVAPWTSRDATGIHEVPATIAVVGGGVVACEASRWLAALGAEVTMLVRDDRLLARAEDVAAEIVATSLRDAGITVRFGVEVGSAYRDPPLTTAVGHPRGTEVTLVVDGGEERYAEVLVATGRRPALRDLGLGSVGVTVPERGGLAAEHLPDWLQVVGDASDGAPLTHWGKYQARLVGSRLAGTPLREPDEVPVPQVVFTDPPVAWVGRTSAEAPDARVLDADMSAVAGASLQRDDVTGWARLVVQDDRLLGATFVGPHAGELLHAATVAIVGGVPLSVLRHAVPAYPTVSEIWLRLLEQH